MPSTKSYPPVNPNEYILKIVPVNTTFWYPARDPQPVCWCIDKRFNKHKPAGKKSDRNIFWCNTRYSSKAKYTRCGMEMDMSAYYTIIQYYLLNNNNELCYPVHKACNSAILLLTAGNKWTDRNRIVFKCKCKCPKWVGFDDPLIAAYYNAHQIQRIIELGKPKVQTEEEKQLERRRQEHPAYNRAEAQPYIRIPDETELIVPSFSDPEDEEDEAPKEIKPKNIGHALPLIFHYVNEPAAVAYVPSPDEIPELQQSKNLLKRTRDDSDESEIDDLACVGRIEKRAKD
jgi:hypothetical protein